MRGRCDAPRANRRRARTEDADAEDAEDAEDIIPCAVVERCAENASRQMETGCGLGFVSHRRARARRTRRTLRTRRARRRDDARARRRGMSPKRRRAAVNADERRCEEKHPRRRRPRAVPSPRSRFSSSSARRLDRRRRVETTISWTWRRIRKTRAETARRARGVVDDDDDETWRDEVPTKASIVETSTRREVMTREKGKQKGDEAAPRASTLARGVARARHGGDGRDSDSGGR